MPRKPSLTVRLRTRGRTQLQIAIIVLMIVGALLLLASPYLSYKLAFGQLFEAVSTTASGWMGAMTATGMEIAGVAYGSALQRQASETLIKGQAQSEIARASAGRQASDLQARAHRWRTSLRQQCRRARTT